MAEPGFEAKRLGSKANVLNFCSMLLLVYDAGGGESQPTFCLYLIQISFSKNKLCTQQPLNRPPNHF